MDTVIQYSHIVEQVLTRYLEIAYANGDIQNTPIFDREAGRYVVMSAGWQGPRRIHGCLLHVEIVDGKIWIQRDGTEGGIANDLVEAGVSPDKIVLGFYSYTTRQQTAFAAA